MPQAHEKLRKKIEDKFGSIDAQGPQEFLKQAGYELMQGYVWKPKPGVEVVGDMTCDEYMCFVFLITEWDYGGLVGEEA